jgi:ribosome-associated toxin RatA of RatAB toxin-antitoxin module
VDGPFKRLEGEWRFDALSEDACKISLTMEFEFAGKMIGLALGGVFNQAANTLVDAFCQRANDVYGR